jgi:NADPH:quinone reductase
MKEVIVHPLPTITTEIRDVPIPTPESDQVIIKVAAAGSNVKGKSAP